jgi:hypothetical protein
MFAGVRVSCWTEEDMAKLKQYKAAQYWGKGKKNKRRKKVKSKEK